MTYDIFDSEAFTKKKADAVRDYLVKALSHYKGKPVLLDDFPEGLLEKVLFKPSKIKNDMNNGEECEALFFTLPPEILRKIDMSNVSFDNVVCMGYNFAGLTGVKINPDTVFPDFRGASFVGVEFVKPIEGCIIQDTIFSNSKGAVIVPSKNKLLGSNTYHSVTFKGSIEYPNTVKDDSFEGSKGALIKAESMDFTGAILDDAKIDGDFYGCTIGDTDFRGAKSVTDGMIEMNPNAVAGTLSNCKFEGVYFTKPYTNSSLYIRNTDFRGSYGFNAQLSEKREVSLFQCNLAGVTFGEDCLFNGTLEGTNFTGSRGAVIDLYLTSSVTKTNFTDARFSSNVEYDVILDRVDDTVVFGNESLREHIKELKRETEQDVGKVLVKIDNAIKKATD